MASRLNLDKRFSAVAAQNQQLSFRTHQQAVAEQNASSEVSFVFDERQENLCSNRRPAIA